MPSLPEACAAARRMLEWRGDVPSSCDPGWRDDPRLQAILPDHPGVLMNIAAQSATVAVTDCARLGTQQLRNALAAVAEQGSRKLILVSKHSVPMQTTSAVKGLCVIPWSLVLMYPLDHTLVPQHRRSTVAALEQERGLHIGSAKLLPALGSDDPIAQYLGLTCGDVVRIARADGSVYWRIIITPVGMARSPGPA